MAIPNITALPPAPLRSQNPATFTTTAENFVDALGDFVTETNAAIDEINALSFSTNSWKSAVRLATTAAITLATGLEAGDSIDGVTLAAGDRVLVKDQSSASENGVYIVAASGAPTRAADMNANDEVLGAVVFVIAGTANGGKIFYSTNTSAVTIGSSSLTFAQFTGGASGSITSSGLTMSTNRLLGRTTASTGAVEELQVGGGLTLASGYLRNIETFQIAMSDMTTNLTTGDGKAGWPIPYDCTLLEVFISLTGARSSSGSVTIDARLGNLASATTIFSQAPSIDANEDTSLTGTAGVLSTTAATKGQTLFFDIDAAGTGAKGLVATVSVSRT